jgi:deoxyhypusine monooxygenase
LSNISPPNYLNNFDDPSISVSSHNLNMAVQTPTAEAATSAFGDPEILALRAALTSESVPLAKRFRALFSLKHHAALHPPTKQTLPAIQAIAAAFPSPSALLKHELAYCLGQTKNLYAVPYLREVLEDRQEDAMCRHEAAEALGAIGDVGSLEMMRKMRDDPAEPEVVRETCEIAVDRIQWESSKQATNEKLQSRYSTLLISLSMRV